MWGDKGMIVGLMKDYHHNSLHVPIEPLILRLHKKSWGGTYWGNIIVRTEKGKTKQAIASMEKLYKQFNPGFPFKYYFTDDEIANRYKAEYTVSKLSRYFAFLAIFISCLGLFGLATFTAETKDKRDRNSQSTRRIGDGYFWYAFKRFFETGDHCGGDRFPCCLVGHAQMVEGFCVSQWISDGGYL